MTALVLLLACGQGVIALGDEASGPGTGDTGLEEEDPVISQAAGDYATEIYWEIPDFDWYICEGEDFDFTVDDDGVLTGDGECRYYGSGGGEYDMFFQVEGTVDEDGEVTGSIDFDCWEYPDDDWELNELSGEVEGNIDEDGDVQISFESYANYDGYYDYGDMDVVGEIWGGLD